LEKQPSNIDSYSLPVPKGFLSNFADPFDKNRDITREQNQFYVAKLDWILIPKEMTVKDFGIVDCADISDHHLVWLTIPWK
jgi:hypothetical protein